MRACAGYPTTPPPSQHSPALRAELSQPEPLSPRGWKLAAPLVPLCTFSHFLPRRAWPLTEGDFLGLSSIFFAIFSIFIPLLSPSTAGIMISSSLVSTNDPNRKRLGLSTILKWKHTKTLQSIYLWREWKVKMSIEGDWDTCCRWGDLRGNRDDLWSWKTCYTRKLTSL